MKVFMLMVRWNWHSAAGIEEDIDVAVRKRIKQKLVRVGNTYTVKDKKNIRKHSKQIQLWKKVQTNSTLG